MTLLRTLFCSYHSEEHNCYDYVLSMVAALGADGGRTPVVAKRDFCDRYLLPKTAQAAKYISLYRQIRASTTGCVTKR